MFFVFIGEIGGIIDVFVLDVDIMFGVDFVIDFDVIIFVILLVVNVDGDVLV